MLLITSVKLAEWLTMAQEGKDGVSWSQLEIILMKGRVLFSWGVVGIVRVSEISKYVIECERQFIIIHLSPIMIGWLLFISVPSCMLSTKYPWPVGTGLSGWETSAWITLQPRVRANMPILQGLLIEKNNYPYLKEKHHNKPPLLVGMSNVPHKSPVENHQPANSVRMMKMMLGMLVYQGTTNTNHTSIVPACRIWEDCYQQEDSWMLEYLSAGNEEICYLRKFALSHKTWTLQKTWYVWE